MDMAKFTDKMIRLDEDEPESDIANSSIPVMAIDGDGVIYSIKDVSLEYDEDNDSNTVWLKITEF